MKATKTDGKKTAGQNIPTGKGVITNSQETTYKITGARKLRVS